MDVEPDPEAPSDEEALATYTAARGFLYGQWVGAVLLTLSYAQLYYAVWTSAYSGRTALIGGALLVALGAWVYLSSRSYFQALNLQWGRRSAGIATVFAGSGAVFWLLFILLVVLYWRGVPLTR